MPRSGSQLPKKLLTLFLVGAAICDMGGCGDGGPDDQLGAIVPIESITPDRAWQSIQQSLNCHKVEGWTSSIGVEFEYVPDPFAEAAYPGAWSPWGRSEELAFAQTLFAASLEFRAQMTANGTSCPPNQGTTARWPAVEYSVVVSGAGGESPITYRGVADLEFQLEGTFWRLSRWADLHGAPAPWNENVICPTLGHLRAAYRGR